MIIKLGSVDVFCDSYLPPHARFFFNGDLYVGVCLYREMRNSNDWPDWARNVFWEVA